MGRRKGRKRRRGRDRAGVGAEALRRSGERIRRRARDFPDLPPEPEPVWRERGPDPRDLLGRLRAGDGPRVGVRLLCGDCREFVPDDEAGRGRCLHPGSGVFSPWPDTAACQFHEARRS